MSSSTVHNSIPPEDARRLISAHDGNVALLYIWQSLNGRFDAEAAARDLCMTASAVSEAKEKLDRLFSSPSSGKASPDPSPEREGSPADGKPPQYSAADVKTILTSGNEFSSVVEEATKTLGRALSPTDLSTLLGIYDHLGMPAEVMMELINYCSETSRERYGPSRRLPVIEIYREASRWAAEGILSFEEAEKHIAEKKQLRTRSAEIGALLKLDTAHITSTPVKYIESWAAMGFDDGAITEAFDRTFTMTGKLQWPYMDAILKKWHADGLHCLNDINSKDGRKTSANKPASNGSSGNRDAIAEFIKNSKNKE